MIITLYYSKISDSFSKFFQDEASLAMYYIVRFHHDIMFYLVFIFGFTLLFLIRIVKCFSTRNIRKKHSVFLTLQHFSGLDYLEIGWTIFPMIILFSIASPSIYLIYQIDTLSDPAITIKIIGHQWYWSYETNDVVRAGGVPQLKAIPGTNRYALVPVDWSKELMFDAYMIPTEDLEIGQFRLLETTETLFLPTEVQIRILVTSSDVIHSWAVPALGIKVDAVPGRLNQAVMEIFRFGTFYGQCSEICGVNHGFMPIRVTSIPWDTFLIKTLVFCPNKY